MQAAMPTWASSDEAPSFPTLPVSSPSSTDSHNTPTASTSIDRDGAHGPVPRRAELK
jgi:hypothetical protein